MATINYNDLRETLIDLNEGFTFDDGQRWDYYGIARGHRIGIEYDGNHITNCDTGDIQENPLQQKVKIPGMIHPDKRDNFTSCRKWVVFQLNEDGVQDPQFAELNAQLGRQARDVCRLGGYDIIAERGDTLQSHMIIPIPMLNNEMDSITIYSYWEEQEKDNFIVLLGWRVILKNIINANIPGVTREALEEKFNIVI